MIEVNEKMIEKIVKDAQDPGEAARVVGFMSIIAPCVKRNAKLRYPTAWGDKTEVGLYRSLRRLFDESTPEQA